MNRLAVLQVARRAAASFHPNFRTIYTEALVRRLLALAPDAALTTVLDNTHLVGPPQLEDVRTIPIIDGGETLQPANPIRGFSVNEIERWLNQETVVPIVARPLDAEAQRMQMIEKSAVRWAEGIYQRLLDLAAAHTDPLHAETA